MKKNVIVLLLIVIMASCSIGTVPVMAAEIEAGDVVDSGTCGETAAWTLTGTEDNLILTISGSGAMQKDWQKIGSTWYYFNGSGVMQTGWQKIGSKWYYFEGSGVMAANKWVGNYYLTASGAMATNTWIGKYYVGADGKWIPGYKAAN